MKLSSQDHIYFVPQITRSLFFSISDHKIISFSNIKSQDQIIFPSQITRSIKVEKFKSDITLLSQKRVDDSFQSEPLPLRNSSRPWVIRIWKSRKIAAYRFSFFNKSNSNFGLVALNTQGTQNQETCPIQIVCNPRWLDQDSSTFDNVLPYLTHDMI